MQTATAITTSLRGLAFAGLAGAMIALATAQVARADSAVTPAVAAEGVTTAQKASVPPATRGEDQTPAAKINREYLIKAAILFNFAKFASWPETSFSYAGAPLRICVLGEDPFGAALDSLHGKQVRNRPLAIARINAVEEAPQCHILFVSASEEARIPTILDYVSRLPILTVADMGRFANSGGIIALKEVDNRSRIEINIGAAEQAGVKLSSKLLRLADMVSTQAAQDQAR
jgi:hypothetical protein